MSVRVSIPPTLRKLCGGEDSVRVRPGTVDSLVDQLQQRYNGVRERLCDEQGRIRGSVLVFVNDEDIRFLRHQQTELCPGDEVSIIPAFAGGKLGRGAGDRGAKGVAQSALWPFWGSNFIHGDGLIGSCPCFRGLCTDVLGEVGWDGRGPVG